MNHETAAVMKSLRFGIEIETNGLRVETITRILAGIEGCGGWKAVHDGSLSGGTYSGEVVSPILTYGDLEKVQAIVRKLRENGATVDTSTGIHIHVDGSSFSAQQLLNLGNLISKEEKLIHAMLNIHANRLRYCGTIDPNFVARLRSKRTINKEDVNAAWYGRHVSMPSRYDSSRYRGLNLNSYFYRGTIEFRYFNGTLHAGEVKAYIQFALALATKALTSKSVSKVTRVFDETNERYSARVLMHSLDLQGDEFKTARHHLSNHLRGPAQLKRAAA